MTEQERDEMIEQIFELTAVTHDNAQECIDILERKVAALEAENAELLERVRILTYVSLKDQKEDQ